MLLWHPKQIKQYLANPNVQRQKLRLAVLQSQIMLDRYVIVLNIFVGYTLIILIFLFNQNLKIMFADIVHNLLWPI